MAVTIRAITDIPTLRPATAVAPVVGAASDGAASDGAASDGVATVGVATAGALRGLGSVLDWGTAAGTISADLGHGERELMVDITSCHKVLHPGEPLWARHSLSE